MVESAALLQVPELVRLVSQDVPPALRDVRWRLGGPPGLEEYQRGHVPGAAYVDLETDLAAPPGPGGRHPLPDPDRFVEAMRRCGVDNDRPVVVYDAVSGTSAARRRWLLRYFGHREVWVLDGGYPCWVSEGAPVQQGMATPARGDFTGEPGHLPVLDATGASRVARDGVLVDARAADRFRGEHEPVDPVAGHIPGAVNVPTADNLAPVGSGDACRFRPPGELAERYRRAGSGKASAAARSVSTAAPASPRRMTCSHWTCWGFVQRCTPAPGANG